MQHNIHPSSSYIQPFKEFLPSTLWTSIRFSLFSSIKPLSVYCKLTLICCQHLLNCSQNIPLTDNNKSIKSKNKALVSLLRVPCLTHPPQSPPYVYFVALNHLTSLGVGCKQPNSCLLTFLEFKQTLCFCVKFQSKMGTLSPSEFSVYQ